MSTSERGSSWSTIADLYGSLPPGASTSSPLNSFELFEHVPSSSPPAGVQPLCPSLLKITWRLITLPFDIVCVGVGALLGSFQLFLSLLGIVKPPSNDGSTRFVLTSSSESSQFVAEFKREFGSCGTAPCFVEDNFKSALLRSKKEYKLLFVYLHSPDHPDVPYFCDKCLCAAPVSAFLNENFIIWGGSIRNREGSKVRTDLSAYHFPFCAIIIALTNQPVVLLHEKIGPKPPEEMLEFLQGAAKKYNPMLAAARTVENERHKIQSLRQERYAILRATPDAYRTLLQFPHGGYEERRIHSSVTGEMVWRLIAAGLGLFVEYVWLGAYISYSVLSYSLSLLDRTGPQSATAAEAAEFVAEFTRDFGSSGTAPHFVAECFYSGLQRASKEKKLFFVYLHSPDDPQVSNFCKNSLCAAPVAAIINDHFIAWAGKISRPEGSKMSKRFKVSSFPFCTVLASINEEWIPVEKVKGSISPEEMLDILQTIVAFASYYLEGPWQTDDATTRA